MDVCEFGALEDVVDKNKITVGTNDGGKRYRDISRRCGYASKEKN